MQLADYFLQRWRIDMAIPWIHDNGYILDIGCFHGELFQRLDKRIKYGVGLDPLLEQKIQREQFELLPEPFRESLPFTDHSFDAVVMLATLEHILDKEAVARECARLLRQGGKVIITVPEPLVDRIIEALVWLHLADGMSLEQHHGFIPSSCVPVFESSGFILLKWKKFQLGLNNLMVFERK